MTSKAKTTTPTTTAAPSEYDQAMVAFKSAEAHLADLRQRRIEAEKVASDLEAKASEATVAKQQAIIDNDLAGASKHGTAATNAAAKAADAREIAAAMVAGLEAAERAVLDAEDALDHLRRIELDAYADSHLPALLEDLRTRATPIFRALHGAGDTRDFRSFLISVVREISDPVFTDEVSDQLEKVLPVPVFKVKSRHIGTTRRRDLGLPFIDR